MIRKSAVCGCLGFCSALGMALLCGCAPPVAPVSPTVVPRIAAPSTLRITLRAQTEIMRGRKWQKEDLEATRLVLERRIKLSCPTISPNQVKATAQSPDRITLELPAPPDEKMLLQRLTTTRNLQFYLVPQFGNVRRPGMPPSWLVTMVPNAATKTQEETIIDSQNGRPITDQQLQLTVFSREPVASGQDVLPQCKVEVSPQGGGMIAFDMTPERSREFESLTKTHIGDHLAVFLDKKLVTVPVINTAFTGKGILEGHFTLESARDLADSLNAGALPVPVETVKVEHPSGTAH